MNMKVALLIVAAGRGSRLGGDIPKQYRDIAGKVVLRRSIEQFIDHPLIEWVQAVIHPDDRELYESAVSDLTLLPPVSGGASRQESVIQGLEALGEHDPDVVLIHDGARPFVGKDLLERILEGVYEYGAVIPALPVVDSLKHVKDGIVQQSQERTGLFRAQTPQAFRYKLIYMAHRRSGDEKLTDDCAVAERCGIHVHTVEGCEDNFKITTRSDLEKAQRMLKSHLSDIRTGHGIDVHAFEDGDHIMLGGVKIPHGKALKGHSDADVALHALTDALLGALGEKDIGAHFPPNEEKWKGAPSDIFLKHARDLILEKNGVISNVDVTVICEAPKIGPHREAVRDNIAHLLEITPDRVSLKATTTEKLGFTGRGEGIMAEAVATIRLPE